MNWKRKRFEDFITLQRGFDLPKTQMKNGDIPVLGSNCIIGFHNLAKVEPPGVVTGRSGTLGIVQYTERAYWPHNTALWVKDFKGNDPRYVYYFLKTLNLSNFNGGASVPTLNRNVLDNLPVFAPQYEDQISIVNILSAYDNLIENNRRRIQLLERAARLIYEEWFVRLRFPGHEKVEIKDDVPEGWERSELNTLANITMGQSPKSIYYNENGNGLPFHQGVTNFGFRFPTHKTFCSVKARLGNPGDILFSVRAPVGRINLSLDEIVLGRGLSGIRSKKNYQNFLFYNLKNHFFKEDLIGGGAIFAAVTKKDLYSVKLLIPTDDLILHFQTIVRPMDNLIENLHKANIKLEEARDLLLPRLMNGEIEV